MKTLLARSAFLVLAATSHQLVLAGDDAAAASGAAAPKLSVRPLKFKGVAIGASRAELLKRFPAFECATAGPSCALGSPDSVTYAGVPLREAVATFSKGRLQHVRLKVPAERYDQVLKALTSGYGAPSASSPMSAVWVKGDAWIVLARSAEWPLNTSSVFLSSRAELQAAQREGAARDRHAAGDL